MGADREPVIGIDLGTTNSVVATVQSGSPVVIRGRSGVNLLPSVVALARSGKLLVGQIAKRQAITNPTDTVYASKRLIGRKFSSQQVQASLGGLPYVVEAGDHDDIRVKLGDRRYSLPELSAMVLKELKLDAEAFFGKPVKKAIITVPAYFNDGQRQATKDAGRIAGLEVLRIINEPTAAALAYGFGKNVNGKIAVFDLGGGTFDISVLEIGNGVFDVIATGGDTFLGGEDFDNRIIDWLAQEFEREHKIDLRKDRMALQRLKDAAEKAKIELSTTRETQVNLPFVSTPPGGGSALHLQKALNRDQLEALTADLVQRTVTHCEQVLEEARVKPIDLREMILVGGMTRMPAVQEAVKHYFRRDPSKGVHPDEVVALGAAVQAEALTNEATDVVLLDVTPQSLGVAIAGGYVRRLIPKNTTVPTAVTEIFNTSRDNQTTVKIMVLQGESDLAHENELLGEFILTGLRLAKRGEVEIDVNFEINSEGLVSVSARDRETGQQQSIQVTASGGLTQDELKKILDEQADMLLEARAEEEVRARHAELTSLMSEVNELIPQLQKATQGTDFGGDALSKAKAALEQAAVAVKSHDLKVVTGSIDALTRTVSLFKGVLQRIGR
ncbi:MAG: molecular chaperone DnaK [Archangium gephyra]|uniref:Chaperone protein DnaK n=1 Tax=Archangium gephyra TaxID=48 RepID=A0A2W5TCL6_9BACT|nr:MAG: molecular chaperone DnaK [Archangium gephyra]